MQSKRITPSITSAAFLLFFAVALSASALEGPPQYRVTFLGNGTPTAINNEGTVIGQRVVNSSYFEPLVSDGGQAWVTLPVPTGAMSTFPTDLNEAGVIVGVSYDTRWNPVAVRWTPTVGGYDLEILPRLPGDGSSYATAINNLGEIVGARRALGYVPAATTGWLYSEARGVVDLYTTYALATVPTELNDAGKVLSGAGVLTLSTGTLEQIGETGPANYQPITGVEINDAGMILGSAALRSTSLNVVSVFRFIPGTGWSFIVGSSRYTSALDINNFGDISFGELGSGLYLEGLGVFALGGLLDPIEVSAGWKITGSGCYLNDLRQVVASGTNPITGKSGAVLLTPAGTLPPPPAPTNLQATAHYATSSAPYNSIDLSWQNTSPLTRTYELERRPTSGSVWTKLTLVPPGSATSHVDSTVGAGLSYTYRVRAVGLAGAGDWSLPATATAPTTPLDTTPPVVGFLNPQNGASVTGFVPVGAQATDNVGVAYLEISLWDQFSGQAVMVGSVTDSGVLNVNWDSRPLTPATYDLYAKAQDALGNWSQTKISVTVQPAVQTLTVSDITLSGAQRGKKANITGTVLVENSQGASVSKASVKARWTIPGGAVRNQTVKTDARGLAKFTISGKPGTFTLTVTSVTKAGHDFDTAGSVLTKSITP